jgi:hypothetical protein
MLYPNIGLGDSTLTFSINGYNPGTTTQNGTIELQDYAGPDPAVNVSIQVTPTASPWETPDQEPDGPCPICGGKPIYLANGDTWITQPDYSIPGLGGGLALTRT